MEHELRSTLLELAERYAQATGRSMRTIGKLSMNDNTFFSRIERGDGFNVKTYDRMVEWFSANWPDSAAWPKSVRRQPVAAEVRA